MLGAVEDLYPMISILSASPSPSVILTAPRLAAMARRATRQKGRDQVASRAFP
jgi:hypothetical protein